MARYWIDLEFARSWDTEKCGSEWPTCRLYIINLDSVATVWVSRTFFSRARRVYSTALPAQLSNTVVNWHYRPFVFLSVRLYNIKACFEFVLRGTGGAGNGNVLSVTFDVAVNLCLHIQFSPLGICATNVVMLFCSRRFESFALCVSYTRWHHQHHCCPSCSCFVLRMNINVWT